LTSNLHPQKSGIFRILLLEQHTSTPLADIFLDKGEVKAKDLQPSR